MFNLLEAYKHQLLFLLQILRDTDELETKDRIYEHLKYQLIHASSTFHDEDENEDETIEYMSEDNEQVDNPT